MSLLRECYCGRLQQGKRLAQPMQVLAEEFRGRGLGIKAMTSNRGIVSRGAVSFHLSLVASVPVHVLPLLSLKVMAPPTYPRMPHGMPPARHAPWHAAYAWHDASARHAPRLMFHLACLFWEPHPPECAQAPNPPPPNSHSPGQFCWPGREPISCRRRATIEKT